jgi:hypothetical protein
MLTGVLVFLLIMVALLAIPVTLTFQMSWSKAFQQDALLKWAFGLVTLRIPGSAPKALSSGGDESKRRTRRSKQTSGKRTNVLAAIRQKPFRRRIVRFIGDLWRAVHKKDLSLRVRVGLGDPADTGRLWAIVGPIAGLLATVEGAAIAIEPEFSDSAFEFNSAGSIRLIPLQLIWMTIALLLSPSIWQGVVKMRKGGR